jgi:hypothetical protein
MRSETVQNPSKGDTVEVPNEKELRVDLVGS